MAEGGAVGDGRRKKVPGKRGEPFPILHPSGWWDRSASFRSHCFFSTLSLPVASHTLPGGSPGQGVFAHSPAAGPLTSEGAGSDHLGLNCKMATWKAAGEQLLGLVQLLDTPSALRVIHPLRGPHQTQTQCQPKALVMVTVSLCPGEPLWLSERASFYQVETCLPLRHRPRPPSGTAQRNRVGI